MNLGIDFPAGTQGHVGAVLDCLTNGHAYHFVGVEDVPAVTEIRGDGLSKRAGIEVAGISAGFEYCGFSLILSHDSVDA